MAQLSKLSKLMTGKNSYIPVSDASPQALLDRPLCIMSVLWDEPIVLSTKLIYM